MQFIHIVYVEILFLPLYVHHWKKYIFYPYSWSILNTTALFWAPDLVPYHYQDINL